MTGGDGAARTLSGLLARFGGRKGSALELPAAPPPTPDVGVFPTKTFRTFLACLAHRPSPVVLDVGPVVGANVAFFGERLGCKIFVADLPRELERLARQDRLLSLPDFVRTRFPQASASVDGVLCWDLLDYLDGPPARALASELVRLLRPGGALLGFFGTADPESQPGFAKFSVIDEWHLGYGWCPAGLRKRSARLTRDIIKLFEGLLVSESFLLKINIREMLFRKPLVKPAGR